MLTSTYIHITGVGPLTERYLWDQGSLTWNDYLQNPGGYQTPGVSPLTMQKVLTISLRKLESFQHQYFVKRLPKQELWRTFPEFRNKTVYLDIETDGGFHGEAITIIGLYDGVNFKAYVRGENLLDFEEEIQQYSLIVTFFGTGFDLPIIRRGFPNLKLDQLHLDLCPMMRRLGYRGGLKAIEKQLGITRGATADGLTGRDAIQLWKAFCRGNQKALDTLIEYNREDVVNLETLTEIAYAKLRESTMGAILVK